MLKKYEEANQFIPIFIRDPHQFKYDDPIDGFNELLKNKPIGSWLIRESRVEGMITLMHKMTPTSIVNMRFAFIDGQWILGAHAACDKHTHFDINSEQTILQRLLNKILAVLPVEKMIQPLSAQSTLNKEYYFSKGPESKEDKPSVGLGFFAEGSASIDVAQEIEVKPGSFG